LLRRSIACLVNRLKDSHRGAGRYQQIADSHLTFAVLPGNQLTGGLRPHGITRRGAYRHSR
jgi:hypothetical protein